MLLTRYKLSLIISDKKCPGTRRTAPNTINLMHQAEIQNASDSSLIANESLFHRTRNLLRFNMSEKAYPVEYVKFSNVNLTDDSPMVLFRASVKQTLKQIL